MEKAVLTLFVLSSLCFAACASSQPHWTRLKVQDTETMPSEFLAIKTRGSVIVLVAMKESLDRYQAEIEIRNDGKKTIHGPQNVALEDGTGAVQRALGADMMAADIERRAEVVSHVIFDGDWLRQQARLNEIEQDRRRDLANLKKDYLHAQDVPPNGTLNQFIQFARTSTAGPLDLTVVVEKERFRFRFYAAKRIPVDPHPVSAP